MTKNTNRAKEEVSDVVEDDSVDSRPAEPVEETPNTDQAAEPVDNVGEVVGRRNEDLLTDNSEDS